MIGTEHKSETRGGPAGVRLVGPLLLGTALMYPGLCAGSVVSAGSAPADQALQPTSAWGDRTDPENWFRGAPEEERPGVEDYPQLHGYSELNLEYDKTIGESFDDTLVNIRSDIFQEFNPTLSLASDVRVVFDGEDDGLRTYNTDLPFEGVYIRKLTLKKENDKYALFGGKFEPGYRIFGYAPIFFGNFSTDLNLEERTGIGGALFLKKEENTELRFTGQVFYLDKSWLSGELLSGRARDGAAEGQVGDTGRLDNFFLSLNGGVVDWEPGLRYSVGIGRQRPGEDVDHTEHAMRGAMYHIHRLSGGGDLEFSIDLLRLDNAGGFNEDNESVTFGGGYSDWPTYAGLSYSVRDVEDFDEHSTRTDQIIEVVLRKGITDSTLVEAAYQYTHANHAVERNVGIVFRYYADWRID